MTNPPSSGLHDMKTILFLSLHQPCLALPPKFLLSCIRNIPCSLTVLQLVLKVINSVSRALALLPPMPRLCIQQFVLECLPVWIRARVLDDNLFVIIGQLVDDVFERFAKLELIELGDALGRDGDSSDSGIVSE